MVANALVIAAAARTLLRTKRFGTPA